MTKRILIVDDSSLSRKRFLARPLSSAGYEVVEAANGDEGLAAWESKRDSEENFDCIITDLLMPGMDGFMLIEKLKASGCVAPIIVASADIQASSREKITDAGAAGFLCKPYTDEALLECVQGVLGATAEG